jgi:hypothetical protein
MKTITITDEEIVVSHTLVPESDKDGESVADSSKSIEEDEMEKTPKDCTENLEEAMKSIALLDDLSIPSQESLSDLFGSHDETNQIPRDFIITGEECPQYIREENTKCSLNPESQDPKCDEEDLWSSLANVKIDDDTPLSEKDAENTKVVSVPVLQTSVENTYSNVFARAELDSSSKDDRLMSYQQNGTVKVNENSETYEEVPPCITNTMDHDCFVNIGQNLFEESNGTDRTSKDHHDHTSLNKKVPSVHGIFYALLILMVSYYSSQFKLLSNKRIITSEAQTNLSPGGFPPDSLLSCNGVDHYFFRDMHDCKGLQTEPSLINASSKSDLEGTGKGHIPEAVVIIVAVLIIVMSLSFFLLRDNEAHAGAETNLSGRKPSLNMSSPSPTRTKRAVREAASLEKDKIMASRYLSELLYKGELKEVKRSSRILPQSPNSCPSVTKTLLFAKSNGTNVAFRNGKVK